MTSYPSTVIQFVDPASSYVLAIPNSADALLVPQNFLKSYSCFVAPTPGAHVLCSASVLSTMGNEPCYLTASGAFEKLDNAADVELLPVPSKPSQVYITVNKQFLRPPPAITANSYNATTPFTTLLSTKPYAWNVAPAVSACVLQSGGDYIAWDASDGFTLTKTASSAQVFESVNWNLVLAASFVASPPSVMTLVPGATSGNTFLVKAQRTPVTSTSPQWTPSFVGGLYPSPFPGDALQSNGAFLIGVKNGALQFSSDAQLGQSKFTIQTVPLLSVPFTKSVFSVLPLSPGSSSSSSSCALPAWAIALIAVGGAALIVAIVLAAFYGSKYNKEHPRSFKR